MGKKMGKQAGKDYIIYPALAGTNWKQFFKANAIADLIRNYWAYMVIFCGHFPDGAEKFAGKVSKRRPAANGIYAEM